MRWLIVLCLALGACSSIQSDELISGGAATAATAVGTALVNPVVGAAAGVGATVTSAVVTPKSPNGVDLTLVPEEERAGVAKWQATLDILRDFGWYIGIGLAAWFFLPLILGYLMPNGRQRKMEKDMFNDPNYRK